MTWLRRYARTAGASRRRTTASSGLDALFAPVGNEVIWGATPSATGAPFGEINPTHLANLETMTGRRLDAVRIFKSNCNSTLFSTNSNERLMGTGDANGGRLVVISIKASPFTEAQVIAGDADATLQSRCNEINAYGNPVILGIHHEPEGPGGEDMPSATWNALQKKVLPFFRSRCPNLRTAVIYMGFAGNNAYVRASWPNNDTTMDSIVDWIGFDPYSFRSGGGSPQALSAVMSDALLFTEESAGRASKPILVAECGCADDPEGQNGAAITDAGAGKSDWMDAAGAWMRDNTSRGQRIKCFLYYHSAGTVPTTPVDSTFNGYTASGPTRTADPTRNSLEAWKRISAFPRTFPDLGF